MEGHSLFLKCLIRKTHTPILPCKNEFCYNYLVSQPSNTYKHHQKLSNILFFYSLQALIGNSLITLDNNLLNNH